MGTISKIRLCNEEYNIEDASKFPYRTVTEDVLDTLHGPENVGVFHVHTLTEYDYGEDSPKDYSTKCYCVIVLLADEYNADYDPTPIGCYHQIRLKSNGFHHRYYDDKDGVWSSWEKLNQKYYIHTGLLNSKNDTTQKVRISYTFISNSSYFASGTTLTTLCANESIADKVLIASGNVNDTPVIAIRFNSDNTVDYFTESSIAKSLTTSNLQPLGWGS